MPASAVQVWAKTHWRELIVRFRNGTVRRIENPTADRVLTVER